MQQVWKNGSLLMGDSNTDASLTDGGIRIGNLNGFVLGEVFIVNGQVSSHARIASEGYLAHKWRLSSNLPADHPYKNNAPCIYDRALSAAEVQALYNLGQ